MSTGQLSAVRQRNNVTVSGNPAGRPLVFAHGFGCSSEMWHLVAPRFEEDYLVVTFDHVGAGASDLDAYDRGKYDSLHGYADDILEILDDLDLTDVVFVGHSVSAMMGVLAATRQPGRFGALVLVGPSPRYVNTDAYTGGFEQDDIDSLLDALDANYLGWSEAMAPVIMGNPTQPQLGESLTASFCSTDPTIARHFARVTFLSDNRRDLPLVTTPTLVVQCKEDVIAPLPVGQYVHESIPNSTLVVLDATGHCPNLSAPDELTAEIQAFLR
ncbi:sigma-B regulation protein RsbQ [Okibacterium sp. HSC-33S16]|uniref:alpha/beta fold hydrolase n=1 Tax=Okibacterium sp. HSC-33S16 TaxID=2910965 RepID=UPI0020A1A91F|nr:alpha/beta hydrolase [Okibacterium sp. HSC-33S16]MCP2032198.1 sigma-B regulation protein RsbQ [Okibacterium sp. HSC-33S16]